MKKRIRTLATGATDVVFEGLPTFSDAGRFWQMIERQGVAVFYTVSTAIRSLIRAAEGNRPSTPTGTICAACACWVRSAIETGGHMITPLPGATGLLPGSCALPFPAIAAAIVDETGNEVPNGESACWSSEGSASSSRRTPKRNSAS